MKAKQIVIVSILVIVLGGLFFVSTNENAEENFDIGLKYLTGDGLDKDSSNTFKFFEKVASEGLGEKL